MPVSVYMKSDDKCKLIKKLSTHMAQLQSSLEVTFKWIHHVQGALFLGSVTSYINFLWARSHHFSTVSRVTSFSEMTRIIPSCLYLAVLQVLVLPLSCCCVLLGETKPQSKQKCQRAQSFKCDKFGPI